MRGCRQRVLSKEAPVVLVPSFTDLLQPLSCLMTAPSYQSFLTLVTGWVFTRRHTVTGMILAADAVGTPGAKHHSAYHRLFAARWSLDELGMAIFGLLLPLVGGGVIMLAADDTLARKRGRKIYGVGMHHDPLISSRKKSITNRGHSWVILGVLVRVPFADRYFCLPILLRLYLSKQTIAKRGGSYKTKPELLFEMLRLLCYRHMRRDFHLVADSAYGGQKLLRSLPVNCDLTSRLRMDARLYDAAVLRKSSKGGQPRKRGVRLPTPQQMLHGRCRHLELNIYGRRDKSRVADAVARLYAAPQRPLRIVAVQPLRGGRKNQAFYSTCAEDSAEAVLSRYAARWAMEDMIHEAKGQLGFEQPQSWTRLAVKRTAPLAMLLYSLIVLWFIQVGHKHHQLPQRPWYRHKVHASFADMLATLRSLSVEQQVSSLPLDSEGVKNLLHTLIHVVKHAA